MYQWTAIAYQNKKIIRTESSFQGNKDFFCIGLRGGLQLSDISENPNNDMVQDSITDHIDTARENSSHLKFTYRMAIIFAEIAPWYVTYPRF